jgi:modification target Cys-rich repeat protein
VCHVLCTGSCALSCNGSTCDLTCPGQTTAKSVSGSVSCSG